MKRIKNLFKIILGLIYPTTCISCHKIINIDGVFCGDCFGKLEFISPIKCQICSLPIQKQLKFATEQLCISCLNHKPAFDQCYAIFIYNETIGKALIDLKYHDQVFLAVKFARLLEIQINKMISEVDFIASVPIYKKKLIKRKYNQANLIARNICTKKYLPQLLLNTRNVKSQVNLSQSKRKKNLRKTFMVNPKLASKIIGKKILLIDDVMTTGTTIKYCSKALKKSGVDKIFVGVIAKTLLDRF